MVTYQFKPTKDDYLKAFRAFYLSNWFIWAGLMAFMLFLFLCWISSFLFNVSSLEYGRGFLLFFFLALAFFLVFTLLFNPLKAANKAETDERFGSPVEGEVSNEYITFKYKFSEAKLDWGSFHRMIESKDQFLLVHSANKNMFQIIPKRAFSSTEDEQAFRIIVNAKIPKSQSSIDIKSPAVIITILFSAGLCLFLCAFAVVAFMTRAIISR